MDGLKESLKNVPILLVSGEVDALSTYNDISKLIEKLPSHLEWLHLDDYNHIDVAWSDNGHVDVHPTVINFLTGNK